MVEARLEQDLKAAEEMQLKTRVCFNERADEIRDSMEGVGKYYQTGVLDGKEIVKAQNWLKSTRLLFLDVKEEFDAASNALTFTDSINSPSWVFEFDGNGCQFEVLGQHFSCEVMGDHVHVSSSGIIGAFKVTLIWDKREVHTVMDKDSPQFSTPLDHGHPCTKIAIQPRTFKDAFDAQCSLLGRNIH